MKALPEYGLIVAFVTHLGVTNDIALMFPFLTLQNYLEVSGWRRRLWGPGDRRGSIEKENTFLLRGLRVDCF